MSNQKPLKISAGHHADDPILENLEITLKELSESLSSVESKKKKYPEVEKQELFYVRGHSRIAETYTTSSGIEHKNIHPRKDEYIDSANILVLDIDDTKICPEEVHNKLFNLSLNHIIYTSFNHTRKKPKYRIIIPCFMPSKKFCAPTTSKLAEELDIKIDSCSKKWNQRWYYGKSKYPKRFEHYDYHDGKEYSAVDSYKNETGESISSKASQSTRKERRESVGKDGHYYEQIRDELMSMISVEYKSLILNGKEEEVYEKLETQAYGMCSVKGLDFNDYPESKRNEVLKSIRTGIQKIKDEHADAEKALKELHALSEIPHKDFPIKFLPKSIYKTMKEGGRVFMVAEEALALVSISYLMIAMGTRFKIKEESHLECYPSIGVSIILDPGEFKSSLLNPINKYYFGDMQKRIIANHKKQVSKNKTKNNMLKNALKEHQKNEPESMENQKYTEWAEKKAVLEAQIIDIPKDILSKYPLLTFEDATEAGAEQIIFDNNGEAALVTPEGNVMIETILGKHNGGKPAPNLFNRGIANDPISSTRIKRGRQHVEMACLNILALVQHKPFLELITADGLIGLLGRFIFIRPKRLVGKRLKKKDGKPIDWSVFSDVKKAIENAFESEEVTVLLSDEANDLRIDFYNEIETKMNKGNDYENLTEIVNKMCTFSVKIASSFCFLNINKKLSNETIFIQKDEMKNAIELTKFFFEINIDTVKNLQDRETSKSAIKIYQKALEWDQEWIPIGRFLSSHFNNPKDPILDNAITKLMRMNLIKIKTHGNSVQFRLNVGKTNE